jgi:hypothetical protein
VQEGAIDEATSDYFGLVIANHALGQQHNVVGFLLCSGIPGGVSAVCSPFPDGETGFRYINSDATFDDYDFEINEGRGLNGILGITDDGHNNGIVWSSTLWRIRNRLAGLDGTDANTSARAQLFDKIVYRAVDRYYTDRTDFVSAAEAVQRAAQDLTAPPEVLNLIRDQFNLAKLCRGCNQPNISGRPVAVSADIKTHPALANNRVFFTNINGLLTSQAAGVNIDGTQSTSLTPAGRLTLYTAAAGDIEVDVSVDPQSNDAGTVLHTLSDGKTLELSKSPALASPAVSPDAVVWPEQTGKDTFRLRWLAVGGSAPKDLPLTVAPQHMSVEGSKVAYVLDDGTLGLWDAQSGQNKVLYTVGTIKIARLLSRGILIPAGGVALSGDHVAVLSFPGDDPHIWNLLSFNISDGKGFLVSDKAGPLGLTLKNNLLIWAEIVGPQGQKIEAASGFMSNDTDLEAYSYNTDTFYRVLPERGQQGFPSFDGDRLVWQDSALGGNDIFTARLPAGL